MKMVSGPDEILRERLEAGYSLPALSVVAVRLVELAADDSASVDDLEGLIEKDPALAIRLLRIANSPFYRGTMTVTTLKRAIMRIGFHQLRVMALSISLRDTFPMGKVGALDYEWFWRRSLYRGLIAKAAAKHLGGHDPEESFFAGLTLGIGFLVFFDLFMKDLAESFPPGLDDLTELLEWERNRFGVDHRQVGEIALRHWKFPERIVACQRGYGEGEGAEPFVRICELARVLSESLLRRSADFQEPFRVAQKWAGLDESTVNDIIVKVFEEVEGIADFFRIEMKKEKDLLALIEKANRELGKISARVTGATRPPPTRKLPSFDTLWPEDEAAPSATFALEAVAHEIRNPLVAVAGFARKLASSVDPVTKEGRYVQIILKEAIRLEDALKEMGGRQKG
jgi:HD-like signal output (HDOD) protein